MTPIGGNSFSSVRKARAILKEKAAEILSEFRQVLKQAAASGDYETAVKGYIHLLDHIPEEDGERLFDVGVDKKAIEAGKQSGPTIQIGLQIGGMKPALPEPAIEVTDVSTPK
jgi:hypothetical protein